MSKGIRDIADRATRWWAQWTLAQRFATLTAILMVVGALIQGAVLIGVASYVVSDLASERVAQRLDKGANQFSLRAEEFRKVPLILAGTPPIERIVALSAGDKPRLGESLDTWLERLGIIFRSFLQANPHLTQARFIGMADGGREIVRVNQAGDRLEIVDKAHLQRKGHRPYVTETAKREAGEVYVSPVEANVENEKVVKPYQPVIRAGTPIFTDSGELFGVVVVNASATAWLNAISDVSGPPGDFYAANQNRDYIYRSDGGPLFGSENAAADFAMRGLPQFGKLFDPNGPVALSGFDAKGQFVAAHRVTPNPDNRNEFIVIATDTDPAAIFGDTGRLILIGSLIALALAAVGVLAAYFVTRPLKSLMNAARQIAAGKLDIEELALRGRGADIDELGDALRIMQEAVESRDASLRKREADLKAIVDNTIDGLITIDPHGKILRYNRGCEEIFGYSAQEAIGQNISMLMADPEASQHDAFLERYTQTGEKRFIGARREAKGRHKNGSAIDIEVAIVEINVDGEVFFSGIVRDITERKKMDRIKSEFVSMVTHELRTPLTSIMGSLGLLRAGSLGELPDKPKRMVNLAYDNGTRLVNLINDILDIDKIEAGQLTFKRQRETLRELITQSVEQNAPYSKEHGVRITTEGIPDDIVLDTDANRFQQVMENLLSNAAKFSPRGGEVKVSAQMRGSTVRVYVADRGPGIPPEFIDRVFEKFAQADSSDTRPKGGTGLGLSIAKAIVERLGGTIGFDTEVGTGTVFFFDLPAELSMAPEQATNGAAKSQVVNVNRGPAADGLARVLHIEDDADTCAVIAQAIEDIAVVTCVPTAEEARDILLTQSFDLIILDMLLPSENGDSVLRLLKERSTPPPPVLVFSGLEMAAERWPPVTRALVKSRTDIVTLRRHVLELLHREPPAKEMRRSA